MQFKEKYAIINLIAKKECKFLVREKALDNA